MLGLREYDARRNTSLKVGCAPDFTRKGSWPWLDRDHWLGAFESDAWRVAEIRDGRVHISFCRMHWHVERRPPHYVGRPCMANCQADGLNVPKSTDSEYRPIWTCVLTRLQVHDVWPNLCARTSLGKRLGSPCSDRHAVYDLRRHGQGYLKKPPDCRERVWRQVPEYETTHHLCQLVQVVQWAVQELVGNTVACRAGAGARVHIGYDNRACLAHLDASGAALVKCAQAIALLAFSECSLHPRIP